VLATLGRIPRTGEDSRSRLYHHVLEADTGASSGEDHARRPAHSRTTQCRHAKERTWQADVKFPSNGGTTDGYLADPASGKGPGILVIQEWWGLVGHIKTSCDRFAAEGFTALAPDMYHGRPRTEPDGAGKLFMALNIGQAEKILKGAATLPRPHPRREARRRRLLHGRPARPLRRDAQPEHRRDGELLRHPSRT
jgi:hypothetical protein